VPMAITSRVDIAVEFKPGLNPRGFSDIIDFDGNPGYRGNLRVVRSVQDPASYVPNFEFIGGDQRVNPSQSIVEALDFSNLTDAQGKATYGVVIDTSVTRARRWEMYPRRSNTP
jgi:hypothetical protein